MRSLSVPDRLGKVVNEIKELEERLEQGRKLEDALMGSCNSEDNKESYQIRSSVDLKQLQSEQGESRFSFGRNDKDCGAKDFGMGVCFLPGYEDAASTSLSSIENDDYFLSESLGLEIDDSYEESFSVDNRSSSKSLISPLNEEEASEQKALRVVSALSDMFGLDLAPERRTSQYVDEEINSSTSPTPVLNIRQGRGAPSAQSAMQRRLNQLEVDDYNSDGGFRMLSSGDRSLSLPAKLPASSSSQTSLKPLLKRSNSIASRNSFGSLKRTVSFGTLKTREYSISISDHPSCSYGPPISLGWDYKDKEAMAVEEYEEQRLPRRSMEQMVLSYNVRRHLLLKRAGYSKNELKIAIREVERVKRERFITDLLLPTSMIDETMEDVIYRIKAMFACP